MKNKLSLVVACLGFLLGAVVIFSATDSVKLVALGLQLICFVTFIVLETKNKN